MSPLLLSIPLISCSILASGFVAATGGSMVHAGLAGLATGATGLATSTLAVQSQSAHRRLAEEERDRLRLILEQQTQLLTFGRELENLHDRLKLVLEQQTHLLTFGHELENLHDLRKALLQVIDAIQQHKPPLDKESHLLQVIHPSEEPIPDAAITPTPEISSKQPTSKEKAQIKGNQKVIANFLAKRGVIIKSIPPESPADTVINSLSDSLSQNYKSFHDLLVQIKRSMQQGTQFSLSIKEYTQREMASICNFCKNLHAIALLEEYKYLRSPQYLITAKASTVPAAQSFFSGQWLERFSLLAVQRSVNQASTLLNKKISFSYLLNPKVTLPNGDEFELDLICHVNGSFFWIESKTGDYQHHIGKYSKISKLLALDSKHSIMILPDMPEENRDALTSLFSVTICSLSSLEKTLIGTIESDHRRV